MKVSGLIGKKIGMTRIFNKDGVSVPITVIEVQKNYVIQIKNLLHNGFYSVQITTGFKKDKRILKSEFGHFIKSNVSVGTMLREFRVKDISGISVGLDISVKIFENVKKVDVTGYSKGKGFSGTVKRWNFHMQDASHGNSLSHRVPGSIGQNQFPGRVFKGKKMPGHLGNERVTVKNLDVVRIDKNDNIILVKGSVPGNIGSNVIIKVASKFYFF
ncbi:MAG: 50S ribosomal subunit protein L3 [Candidatus Westeberhardia cardiocondylae]|nr:50S ribosomal subunit protein L3 [Candidatus Westeberhardia cardiocondylae]